MEALDILFQRLFLDSVTKQVHVVSSTTDPTSGGGPAAPSIATMEAFNKGQTAAANPLSNWFDNPLSGGGGGGAAAAQAAATLTSKAPISRKKHARQGYFAISYGTEVGYIQGVSIDSQVVMIGFDDTYKVTTWNNAAEVTTGFLESEALGRPLSDLVDSPSGNIIIDIQAIQKTKGQSIKIRLRAFATAPVTLFTIVAAVTNSEGVTIGHILICANAKDNLRETRAYLHDFQIQELRNGTQKLIETGSLSQDDLAFVTAMHEFTNFAYSSSLEEFARGMVYDWEWTTGTQLLGRALGGYLSKCTLNMDPKFPSTVCVNPYVAGLIENAVSKAPGRCQLSVSVVATLPKIYSLRVTIATSASSRPFDADVVKESIRTTLEETSGFSSFQDDGFALELHFPCQIAMMQDDDDGGGASTEKTGGANSKGDREVTFAVNVMTLLSNTVDQHNISMVLLKTQYVSLTNVRDLRDLEKKLGAKPCDVDVIIADRSWYASAKSLGEGLNVILIPFLAEDSNDFAPNAQFSIRAPIVRATLEQLMYDVGVAVSNKKATLAAQEEREKILMLRQDSPWTQGKLLGRGAFGAVYEAISDLTGGKMAVKMFYFKGESEASINDLLNEIKIMCSLNNPNIVHYFYCERKNNSVNLFMELCDYSLADFMMQKRRGLTIKVSQILRQIVMAVAYLHERGIAHRDIKPQNILLKGDVIKLTDFGTSRQTQQDEALSDVQGTFRYMAPEVYRGNPHTLSCDIWSVGCLACELFACPPSFMERRYHSQLGEMTEVEFPPGIGGVLKDFVSQCLSLKPESRPTASMLQLHPLLSVDSAEVDAIPTIFDQKPSRKQSMAMKQSNFSLSSTTSDMSM